MDRGKKGRRELNTPTTQSLLTRTKAAPLPEDVAKSCELVDELCARVESRLACKQSDAGLDLSLIHI